jgi:uncharacterized protein YjbJ (UPF0337 family)
MTTVLYAIVSSSPEWTPVVFGLIALFGFIGAIAANLRKKEGSPIDNLWPEHDKTSGTTAEKARHEQLGRERLAAEEKARQEEEQQRVAAEQARLEEERERAVAKESTIEHSNHPRMRNRGKDADPQAAEEKVRLEEERERPAEGKWKQMKGKVRPKWGQLTDDDFDVIAGKQKQLAGEIQERYGISKEEELERRAEQPALKLENVAAGRDIKVGTASRAEEHILEGPDQSEVPKSVLIDNVHFTLTGPDTLSPGAAHELLFWLHVERQSEAILTIASSALGVPVSEMSVKSEGPFPLTRGSRVSIAMSIPGMRCIDRHKWLTWTGEIGRTSFIVEVPTEAVPQAYPGRASIRLNGCEIAKMSFYSV